MKFLSFLIFSLLVFSAASADFESTNFTLENPINFIGGGDASSSSFRYISTTGQLVQGINTSISFSEKAGFLYFPDISDEADNQVPGGGGGSGNRPHNILPIIPGIDIKCRIADFNCDTRVDIFDLSILLYHVKEGKSGPDVGIYDLSKDQKVNFTDISILFYYWDLT